MSILTKVLKLFCYDPETDGANTFNIPKALNENWEKIDQLVLLAVAAAAAYAPEGSYEVGDYCTHGGKLHKCNTPIPSGEAWNAEHWTETTVAAELVEVRASLSNKANTSEVITHNALPWSSTVQDLHSAAGLLPVNPKGASTPSLNTPPDVDWGVCLSMLYGSTRHLLMMEKGRLWGQSFNGTVWTDWAKFSTATPPQMRNLTLQSGFSANGDCTFFVTQESAVFLAGGVSGTLPANQDTQIGTLPADVSPAAQRRRPAVTNAGAAYIDIHTDGTVWAHPFAAALQCWFDTSFVAGGGS